MAWLISQVYHPLSDVVNISAGKDESRLPLAPPVCQLSVEFREFQEDVDSLHIGSNGDIETLTASEPPPPILKRERLALTTSYGFLIGIEERFISIMVFAELEELNGLSPMTNEPLLP